MNQYRFVAAFLVGGLAACSTVGTPTATHTAAPAPSPTATFTPSPTVIPTSTPLGCLREPGRLIPGEIVATKPPQDFLIYVPRCYEQETGSRYPVLYLLHGQGSQDDQWVKLGVVAAIDSLILSGEAPPIIIVFPDDRYWNLPPGVGFGDRLVHEIIPFVDQNYRTLADREHRLLGGLSRGAGWVVHLTLTRYDLFGTVGFHSPVIFNDDAAVLSRLVDAVPSHAWPRMWIDAGDRDGDLGTTRSFEALLTDRGVPHEWHVYSGDHTDAYWQAHVNQYLRWYVEGLMAPEAEPPEGTPAP
jgi:enterochelin esterase-like enzyme